MNLLAVLASGTTSFRGEGVNEEEEAFIGELSVRMLEDGRAALLGYVAKLHTGEIVHSESTLLGTGPNGKLCLWPVMAELPVVLPHTETAAESTPNGDVKVVFSTGQRSEIAVFREEITIELRHDGSLVYAHAWGLPGGPFDDRSSCRMLPVPA